MTYEEMQQRRDWLCDAEREQEQAHQELLARALRFSRRDEKTTHDLEQAAEQYKYRLETTLRLREEIQLEQVRRIVEPWACAFRAAEPH